MTVRRAPCDEAVASQGAVVHTLGAAALWHYCLLSTQNTMAIFIYHFITELPSLWNLIFWLRLTVPAMSEYLRFSFHCNMFILSCHCTFGSVFPLKAQDEPKTYATMLSKNTSGNAFVTSPNSGGSSTLLGNTKNMSSTTSPIRPDVKNDYVSSTQRPPRPKGNNIRPQTT